MNMSLGLVERLIKGRAGRPRSNLHELAAFGPNPGQLKGWYHAPSGKPDVPLVVALHGCTQSAAAFDTGTGWSQMAEAHGFAVLLPEQQRSNNPNLCFNWFEPGDARRRTGEPLSIAQMIDTMIERHAVDPRRVFITGLSAGGAMSANMLASYPEKFAGGAILAGLAHGAAVNLQEALQQMRGYSPNARSHGRTVREASSHVAPWPTIAIWHGTADRVVDVSNADGILHQWQEIHGVSGPAAEDGLVDGHPRRAWRDASGRLVIEEYRVLGMGHGVPLATGGECACGETGAFMLEAGISSTVHSARAWGLLDPGVVMPARPVAETSGSATRTAAAARTGSHLGHVIDDALRAAGLLR